MRGARTLMAGLWRGLAEGPRWRAWTLLAVVVVAVSTAASLVFEGGRDAAGAGVLAGGLPAPGEILRDEQGRPVLGRDGEPLRLGRDGRTVVDSSGRPVLGRDGEPLALGEDGTLQRGSDDVAGRRRGGGRREGDGRRGGGGRGEGDGPAAADTSPVVIGVAYENPDSINQEYARYGATAGAAHGGRAAQATADYLNAHGGAGGRPIEVKLHEMDLYSGRSYDALTAEACAYFEDVRAVAVVGPGFASSLGVCLESAGIPFVDAPGAVGGHRAFWEEHGGLFMPGGVPMDGPMEVWVRALRDARFFARGERVGLLRFQGQFSDAASRALKPALRAAGVSLTEEVVVASTQSAADIPRFVSDAGSAALRMRAAGVTRVISYEGGGGELVGLFMRTADAQGYRPRYGLTSMSAPNNLVLNVPHEQLRGAVGIGWAPFVDTPTALEENVSQTRRLCSEIFGNAGVSTGSRTPYGQQVAYGFCDGLLLTYFALEGRSISAAAVQEGIRALGDRYTSAISIATRFSANRNWGAAGYRLLRFNSGCGCFRYDGGAVAFE